MPEERPFPKTMAEIFTSGASQPVVRPKNVESLDGKPIFAVAKRVINGSEDEDDLSELNGEKKEITGGRNREEIVIPEV